MAVDRNTVVKLHISGNSNVEIAKRQDINHSTVRKIVKKFQKTTPQKHEEKAAMKPLPKLQNLGHRSRCQQIYHAPGDEGQSGGEALQDAASPVAYGQSCSHESPKMQGNPPSWI